MQDVTTESIYAIAVVDAIQRVAYGAAAIGVSVNPAGTTIHVAQGENTSIAAAIFANFKTLAVAADVSSIPADDTTIATITAGTADASLDWLVVDGDGDVIASGTEAAAGGTVTLEFSSDLAGEYQVWLFRRGNNFASGMVAITVTEVV